MNTAKDEGPCDAGSLPKFKPLFIRPLTPPTQPHSPQNKVHRLNAVTRLPEAVKENQKSMGRDKGQMDQPIPCFLHPRRDEQAAIRERFFRSETKTQTGSSGCPKALRRAETCFEIFQGIGAYRGFGRQQYRARMIRFKLYQMAMCAAGEALAMLTNVTSARNSKSVRRSRHILEREQSCFARG